jgi:hypothetical protein
MLEASAALAAWERAAPVTGPARATALIAVPPDQAVPTADLPLGRRDAALLRLYRDIRGPVVEALATCPACATTLDVRLPIDDLVAGYDEGRGDGDGATGDPVGDFDLGSVRVWARCPTTADLEALAALPDVRTAAVALLERCVRSVRRTGDSAAAVEGPATLTAAERRALGAALERLDPLVDVRVSIACAQCGEESSALLDVPELVWAQVHARARRLLREVDALASRYGWSESAILALSETRRAAYLELD